jgi:hypothetical protein
MPAASDEGKIPGKRIFLSKIPNFPAGTAENHRRSSVFTGKAECGSERKEKGGFCKMLAFFVFEKSE